MLNMDMIIVKKKRIAIEMKKSKPSTSKAGLWAILNSVTQRTIGTESMYLPKITLFAADNSVSTLLEKKL